MAEITDVNFFDGHREVTAPSVVITARTVRIAIELDELDDLMEKALNALEMTGKHIVFIDAEPARAETATRSNSSTSPSHADSP